MTTIEKLRLYIQKEQSSGRLKPGDALPGLRRVCKDLDCFYTTAQRAVKELAREGILRIEYGRGSFLTGDIPLNVDLICSFDVLDRNGLAALLEKHLAKCKLNLALRFFSNTEEDEKKPFSFPRIYIGNTFLGNELNCLPGYSRWKKNLPGTTPRTIPFTYATHVMGVNLDLLDQVGFSLKSMSKGFGWFMEYAEKARQNGFYPMSQEYRRLPSLNWATGILLELTKGNAELLNGGSPFFSSLAGKSFLEIAKKTRFYRFSYQSPVKDSFYLGGAGLTSLTGSWVLAQNKSSFRPDIHIERLGFRNYLLPGKRRLLPVDRQWLSILLPEGMNDAQLTRLSAFTDLLLSKEFQKEYCAMTGMLSERNDLDPRSYFPDETVAGKFLPGDDSVFYELNKLYPHALSTALQALLENAIEYPERQQDILRKMDERKIIFHKAIKER